MSFTHAEPAYESALATLFLYAASLPMPDRLRILLVDDDSVDRMTTRRALGTVDLALDVLDVDDLPAALEALRTQPFDCVLTDYHLPHGDALGLLRSARELGIDCPFLVLTGHGHEQMAVSIMKAGAADYLVKSSASSERLGQAIRHATRVHRVERQRAEAQARERSYAAQLKGLSEASLAIHAATSLEALVSVLAQHAALLVGAHQAATSLVPGVGFAGLATCQYSERYAEYEGVCADAQVTGVLYEQVIRSRQAWRLSQDELRVRYPELAEGSAGAPPMRGFLAAPLWARNGEGLGLLQLSDKHSGEFSEEDENILVQLARAASLSIENARLLAREQHARQHAEASTARIERLQAVTAALSQPASVTKVMEVIVEQAVSVLGVERVATYLVDAETGELRVCAHRNLPLEVVQQLLRIGSAQPFLVSKCVQQRRPIFAQSRDEYAREAAEAARAGIWTEHTRSALAMPLQLSEIAPLGAVAMTFADVRAFDNDERVYFESLADQWAQAIDRARLHDAERVARKQAEVAREQAETANRLKDEFLATISHELRTPLQSILGWARLLRGHTLEPRSQRGVEIIERNARAQAQLIEDILDVSRIITGKLRLNAKRVSVESFVQAAVDTLRAAAEAKDIALTTRVAEDVGDLYGDIDRLQQVVWNLLSNAVKFTPQGGRITVMAERADDEVLVHVSDTGRGIPSEFLPHVFERFRQADASTTRAHSGLGLGLAIVRHLTEAHGGRVSAESLGADQGARFTVRLPVKSSLPPPAPSEVPEPESQISLHVLSSTLLDKRILVVDDETDARELTATVCLQAGAKVASAVSAAEALEKLADFHPDVVVSDIAMPGEDGFALLRRIRALPEPLASVPVLALTAFARPEDRSRMLASGFARHLAKPVEPEVLLETLARVLARSAPDAES